MLAFKLMFITLAGLASLNYICPAEIKFRRDQIPNLNDALTVAKSPLEPVTLTDKLTAQTDGGISRTTELINMGDDDVATEAKQTTRSVDDSEKESIETSAGGSDNEANSKQTQKPDDSDPNLTSTTTSESTETTTTPAPTETESDQETTTLPPVAVTKVVEQIESSTTSAPVTPSQETSTELTSSPETTEPPITTTTMATTSTEIIIPTKEPTTTTTDAPSTTTSTTTIATTTTTLSPTEVTTLKAATETTTTTTSDRLEEASTGSDNSVNGNPARELPEQPTTTTLNPATDSVTSATPSRLPVSTEAATTEQPVSSVTLPSTPVGPVTPESSQKSNKTEHDENKTNCNHLPTYESDEIQKVFREETTFKNGTIRGKFTYINFDQRYRLVHYTRLPYGPVKIDLVEELGRPESSSNQTQPTSLSDIPNAVLQLRNILPNSLFGFPFLGPNSAMNGNNKPMEQREEDKANNYFYSTDTLSTPNLLSPSVPVSLPPGQRRLSKPNSLQMSSDPLMEGQVLETYDPQPKYDIDSHKTKQQETVISDSTANLHRVPNHQQFQYAVSSQSVHSPDFKQPSLIYSYIPQPHHYQYSPVPPFYSLNHPSYLAASHSFLPQSTSYAIKLRHEHHETPSGNHQYHHQPHSHEHYTAPFMLDHSDTSRNSNPQEPMRIQLRVKTSKALNVDSINGKTAKLLASPHSSLSAPVNNPTGRLYQISPSYRHRLGKQNQDLKPTINNAPIVYHILRSPIGHMYNLPQYNQAHALTYDHSEVA